MVDVNSVDALSWNSHGPDVVILREEADAMPPQFYFSSQHLNDLDNERDVAARGQQIKTLFDGALILEQGYGYRPEKMHELWAMDRFARLGHPDPATGITTFSPTLCRKPLSRTEEAAIKNYFVDMALYSARTDKVVHDVLLLLGTHGITFPALYSLTDTMTTNGFDIDKQWRAAGVTRADYRNFKHTANSAAVLGPLARHGEKKDQPPSKPETLERSADMVLAATRTFLLRRMRRSIVQPKVSGISSSGPASVPASRENLVQANKSKPSRPSTSVSPPVSEAGHKRRLNRWVSAALFAAPIGLLMLARRRKSK